MVKLFFNSLSHRIFFFILEIIIISFSVFLTAASLFLNFCSNYNMDSCRRTFSADLDKTGIIRLEGDYNLKQNKKFYAAISKAGFISKRGNYMSMGSKFPELLEIQGNNQEEEYAKQGWTEVTYVTSEMFDICSIGYKPGTTENNTKDMILGYGYKGKIPQGKIFYSGKNKLRVAGFLKKGTRWPSQAIVNNDINSLCNVTDTKYKILAVTDPGLSYTGNIFITSGEKIQDITGKINEIAESCGVRVNTASVKDIITSKDAENSSRRKTVNTMLVFALILAVTTVCSHAILRNISNSRETAVYYSCGMSSKDVLRINLYENLFKFIVSLVLSGGALFLWIHEIYNTGGSREWLGMVLDDVVMREVLPVTLLIVLCLLAVCTLVPFLVLDHVSVLDIIRGIFTGNDISKISDIILLISFTVTFVAAFGAAALNASEKISGRVQNQNKKYSTVITVPQDESMIDPEAWEKKSESADSRKFFSVLSDSHVNLKANFSAPVEGALDFYTVSLCFGKPDVKAKAAAGRNLEKIAGEKKLKVFGNEFSLGKTLDYDKSDERSFSVEIYWDNLDDAEKSGIEKYMNGTFLELFKDISINTNDYSSLSAEASEICKKLTDAMNISFSEKEESDSESDNILTYVYEGYRNIISVLFILFSLIMLLYCLSSWSKEHIRNVAVTRVLGMDAADILRFILRDLFKAAGIGFVLAFIFDLLFFLISGTSLQYLFNLRGLICIVAAAAGIIIISGLYVIMKIRKAPLAEILKERE